MVEPTHLKNISQNANLPQIGWNETCLVNVVQVQFSSHHVLMSSGRFLVLCHESICLYPWGQAFATPKTLPPTKSPQNHQESWNYQPQRSIYQGQNLPKNKLPYTFTFHFHSLILLNYGSLRNAARLALQIWGYNPSIWGFTGVRKLIGPPKLHL